jgi:hypothetical protein
MDNYQPTKLMIYLRQINNKLQLERFQNPNKDISSLEVKLKLLHHAKHKKNRTIKDTFTIINSIRGKNYIIQCLKIIYLIQYRDRLDQQQLKRTIINNFNLKDTEGYNSKKTFAYNNTEHINSLYQLYKLNHYLKK